MFLLFKFIYYTPNRARGEHQTTGRAEMFGVIVFLRRVSAVG